MPAADMTPEREEQLTADLLRERAGIDPGNAGQLADLAAIGLVNGAWRNTCVENWHAQPREPRRRDSHRRQVAGRSTSPGWLDGGGPSGPAEARGPVIRGNSPGSPKQVRLTRPDVQAAVTVVGCPHVVGAMGVLVCRRRRDTERDIRPIDLTAADLTAADLTGANLAAAALLRAILVGARLYDANLTRTNLIGAVLTRAYLGDAKLISTMLQGADLTHANLVGADLTGASLVRTDLTGADLTRANLTDVRWPEGVPVPEGWLVDDKSSGLKLADE